MENTNDLGEHFFECTNDVGCWVEPNSTGMAKQIQFIEIVWSWDLNMMEPRP